MKLAGAVSILVMIGSIAMGEESILLNPTKRAYKSEVVRLTTPAPAGAFVVKEDGVEVAHQVEEIDGKRWIWVCSSFDPGASHKYEVLPGRPRKFAPLVTLRQEGDGFILDNGTLAVKVPAKGGIGIPGPISAIKLGDKWVGESAWQTAMKQRKFTASVIGDGTVLAKLRLRYEFDGMAGIDKDIPAFAQVDVALGPGWSHAEVFERHEMARGDYWEFAASRGWSPRQGVSKPFSGGAGSGSIAGKVQPARDLKPGGLPMGREDLFLNLFPRWNQHYKDGWYFAATDGQNHVGAVVVSASKWIWPHNNGIEAIVRPSGDYAGLRCPTWKGQRLWWLMAPTLAPTDLAYLSRHAWESLDKLNHDFILDWPGQKGAFTEMNLYNGGQMNPTGGLRGAGRRAIADAGKNGDLGTLSRVQAMMHGDTWGSYWNYWSPENPNFFTDFTRLPIALTAQLRSHPRFEQLRKAAEMKLREDMYHSITLPGGAGQECPGYVSYALRGWGEIAPLCKQHLGFDPTTWDRYKAAEYFRKRTTQPDGDVRRQLPMGDTHPSKEGGPAKVDVPADEVAQYATEELPGFGVIFQNQAGTTRETYLAFKSGPNRGHYHGDQLAFHYCANSKPVAVDHHCSYHPRAGQEHMHNRVAFHTDKFPYANMDGYERLIAFRTSPAVDIAIGQVESERLRQVEKHPPEIWHQEYPQHALAKPLIYRRTIVFMKGGPQDYFVIRDQYWAPQPLHATYCLHVRSERIRQQGQVVDFGNLSLFCALPAKPSFESFPWEHGNGGREATSGARLTIHGETGQFITVLYPGKLPTTAAIPGGVKVGDDEITFAGDQPSAGDSAMHLSVIRGGKPLLSLDGKGIDLDRSQGEIGLFVPDAGYPFGEIPDWLIKQRGRRPDWAR